VYRPYHAVIVVGYHIINLRLSAFNYRIIHIRRISLTPYPDLHPHTIGFGLSASAYNRIQIIHIRMDIKNSYPYSHNSDSDQIGCGNYPHHFHPYLQEICRSTVGTKTQLHGGLQDGLRGLTQSGLGSP
jgi:hypothetical protein